MATRKLQFFLFLISFHTLSHNIFVHSFSELEFKLSKLYIECIDHTLVDPVLVLKVISGYITKHPHVSIQKWGLCLLVKMNIMSPEGVVRMDEALKYAPACCTEDFEKKINDCIPKGHELPHEIAWAYIVCYNHDDPDHFKVI